MFKVLLLTICVVLFFKFFKIIPKKRIKNANTQNSLYPYSIVPNSWYFLKTKDVNGLADMFIEIGSKIERQRTKKAIKKSS